ncbi:glycoside hydrolase family 16 protein [Actinomyces sp. ZJ308]|uniref:glycoside hydrolase family 16 protein n=1 Tax=Actinomyces sp. ZJ308 TaxID=2708342 RepID=UPI0014243C5A|nr:glycoside hydrolase family 16 protein [Actinomyces sp. ZJ308]
MKSTRAVQLLMTAGLAVATATACLPIQPQGGAPGAAASSTGPGVEQTSPSGSVGATASTTSGGEASAPAASSSSAEQPPIAGPSTGPSASSAPSDAGSTTPSQPSGGSGQGRSEAEINGWNIDYFEGFDGSFEDTRWGRYGDTPIDQGAMGMRLQRDSFTRDGELIIRTEYQDGQWSAGGASSADAFAASGGRWEVRAKFPQAKGIGYAMLLWPEDEVWPPEVDFAEGRVNGPRVDGTYHWGEPDPSKHRQLQRSFDNPDMSGWHTYGVIVEQDTIIFTFDGQEWNRITREEVGEDITSKRMWFGVQSGAMDPNGSAKQYETVDGGVPGPLTPAVSDIQIDYVAHYVKS